jgi:hypothetical protein
MSEKITRRNVLRMGAAAGTAALAGYVAGTPAKAAEATYPWPYKAHNANAAAKTAYENYYVGGCMYAVFTAIAKTVADKLGAPYTDFPWDFSKYGGGGIKLWGTICGTLNGAAAAISLFFTGTTAAELTSEVFTYYEKTKLPTFKPANPKNDVPKTLPKSKPRSTLCHVSISRWVEDSGYDPFSPERADRCGRMCANVAKFTVGIMNKALNGKFKAKNQISAFAAGCLGCHSNANDIALDEPDVLSKMDCELCHDAETDKGSPHYN